MFGHRSFLVLGGGGAVNVMSLIKGGYEISNCRFSFEQGIDDKGKASTRVYFGVIHLTLSQLPPNEIIEWALNSRKYHDGAIVVLNEENIPIEKVIFQHTACINLKINYVEQGDSYVITEIAIQAEKIIVGNGIDFDNEWTI